MSSFARSNTQNHPAAGSAAEDPTKSYKGFKLYLLLMLQQKLAIMYGLFPIEDSCLRNFKQKSFSDSILHLVGIVSNIARECVLDLLY